MGGEKLLTTIGLPGRNVIHEWHVIESANPTAPDAVAFAKRVVLASRLTGRQAASCIAELGALTSKLDEPYLNRFIINGPRSELTIDRRVFRFRVRRSMELWFEVSWERAEICIRSGKKREMINRAACAVCHARDWRWPK